MKTSPLVVWMASAALVTAGIDADPAARAVEFLEKVRTEKASLEPGADSALIAATSPEKRRQIAQRLKKLGEDVAQGTLEAGPAKVDGELAAVLVDNSGKLDARNLRVVAVALLRKGEKWFAAPLPGSFENTGLGYEPELRRRAAVLEYWMLQEANRRVAMLREQSQARMRDEISKKLQPAELRDASAHQVFERFLAACEARDSLRLTGFVGGLGAVPPDDWSRRLAAIETMISPKSETARPWRLLTSPDVLRVPLEGDDEEKHHATMTLVCLDPMGAPPERPKATLDSIDFDLTADEQEMWSVALPMWGEDDSDGIQENLDTDMTGEFCDGLNRLIPAKGGPDAEKMIESIIKTLHEDRFPATISLLRRDVTPAALRASCVRAAEYWRATRQPGDLARWVVLDRDVREDRAAVMVLKFSALNPDRAEQDCLYFIPSGKSWFWEPRPEAEIVKSFGEWQTAQKNHWRNAWKTRLLGAESVIRNVAAATTTDDAPVRELLGSWFAACRRGDVENALALTVRLDQPDSETTLLRNFGQEWLQARQQEKTPEILSIRRSGPWTEVRLQTETAGRVSYPVHIVLATPAGPRLLLEFDWFARAERSRAFLNKTSLERLGKSVPNEVAALRQLLEAN